MKKINFKIILIILIVTIVGITTYYFKTKDESVENIEVEETNTQSQETNTEENIAVEKGGKLWYNGTTRKITAGFIRHKRRKIP